MQIKNRHFKLLLKLFIVISILECIYLFAIPPVLNKFANTDYIKNLFAQKANAELEYSKIKVKTHIKPNLTIKADKITILDKENNNIVIDAENVNSRFAILPLISKQLNFRYLYADNLQINVTKDKNDNFNFTKLFPKKDKKIFKLKLTKSKISINNLNINSIDEQLDNSLNIKAEPFKIGYKKKNSIVDIKTKGQIITNNENSDFDINIKTKFPFNSKDFNKDFLEGNCYIYNINLQPLFPLIKEYIYPQTDKLEGFIDFIQISADNSNDKNQIIINTQFNNLIFNKENWKHAVIANGQNKFDTNIELYQNIIDVKSLNYKADKINLKSDGQIKLKEKPELDINVEVNNSRAENIASILPPDLVPQYMTIEKVRNYGVFADLDAKVNVKGKIPQPDITGYVKGRNIHVLDESIRNLHKGTVDITFDKRILNMDIDVNLFDNQNAKIKGYVYMFRDGVNNVSVKTTNNIDFPLAQKIVVPVSKVFNFQLGPIPEMNITSGKGIIDVKIQGSMDFVKIDGYSAFDKAQLTYNGLFGEVKNGKGRLDFKDDIVHFKSERAFVKQNPLNVEGKVKINDNLNFNISSELAEGKDLLEIINKSELLKDVKEGLAIITQAEGPTKISVNMAAKIVPVPFGHPPLPPEEAFEDMRVKGSLYLLGNSCNIEGFYTPIDNIKGIVDFTETIVNLNNITGTSGTSPITINGKITNDLETKIPDVDVTVTSKSVNLKDTVKFLSKSYLYPENYPDLSSLYNIASKHDLYFKYKAKSIDFLTDKAYAVMNIVNDDTKSDLKAKSGRVIMDKANVKVENVKANLFDSSLNINGEIKRVDTLNPIYNLTINANKFNLVNLTNTKNLKIVPDEINCIFDQFTDYKGYADINLEIKKNILNGAVKLFAPSFKQKNTNIPFNFDDFNVFLNHDKIIINNMAAEIAKMPFYGDITISNIYDKNPNIGGYFTAKLTNEFAQNYLPEEYRNKITLIGDISTSARFNGTQNNLTITPKLTLQPEADVIIEGISVGETSDKREFDGNISITPSKIIINKLDYVKYVSSQNNNIYPILFARTSGKFNILNDNIIEPEEFTLKTNKNLSAKVLNIFLKNPIFKQGTFSCDLKYKFNKALKIAKLEGNMDCRNLDIPLFDTVIKNIKVNAKDKDIDINLFGFLTDSKINIQSILENNLYEKPKVHSLKISADKIDNDKLLQTLSKTRTAMNTNNEIKNIDLSGLHIENGYMEIKKLIIKSLIAEDFTSKFSINKSGIFSAKDMNIKVGQGNIKGEILYNLNNNELDGDFELKDVDANYVAETLFDGKNQIYGNADGKIVLNTKGLTEEERIKNLKGFVYFNISDGRMPKLGSLEYLLRASNIIKSGITGFTINSILELLNLVKTGYFSNINGSCSIENGIAKDIEIFSKGENLSLYIHGSYDISKTSADMEILGKLSRRISTIFGSVGNTSLNTFFKLIPGISMLDFSRKNFIEDVEKIPSFTNGDYDSRVFQAIINGNINESGYVQSFKWVK